ncbi:hypothetical protein BS47DRAFT_1349911 [Hydnum rufescens UP504]|uniref:Uncharacterized protein n=1 Tax=Hydnum rufescens UP504 TaxID=1448309 RepID=A0A9P6AP62_9AGAM|nr:hypothetical protein BS47DRAFT_1349911 [Hydnum rufescens UP504]
MGTSKSLPPSGLPQQFHPLLTSSCPFAPHVVASSHNNPEHVTLYHHQNLQTLDHRDASPAYTPRNAGCCIVGFRDGLLSWFDDETITINNNLTRGISPVGVMYGSN